MATAWVYWKSEPQLWTVGYFEPDGTKYPADDFSSEQEARDECHYLNGGERPVHGAVGCEHGFSKLQGCPNEGCVHYDPKTVLVFKGEEHELKALT